MSQKLVTHFLRTSQHGTIQVYVNDKYVGTVSSGKLEWKAPKYKGIVKIELKGVEEYVSKIQSSAAVALVTWAVDNTLEAYLKPYEQFEKYDASIGSSMLNVTCYSSFPVTIKEVWNPVTNYSVNQSIINVQIPPNVTSTYIIDPRSGGGIIDTLKNMTYTYNGEIYQYQTGCSFGRGFGNIRLTTNAGREYYINITDN